MTCVRVPVYRAHSVAVSAEFERPVSLEEARAALAAAPGLKVVDDPAQKPLPDAAGLPPGRDDCEVGRLRLDCALDNGLAFWVSGDQLLKGAALNAVQIAELLCKAHAHAFACLRGGPARHPAHQIYRRTFPPDGSCLPPPHGPRRRISTSRNIWPRNSGASSARCKARCRRPRANRRRSTRRCATACSPAARNGCGPSSASRRRKPAAATARKPCRSPARWSASTPIR